MVNDQLPPEYSGGIFYEEEIMAKAVKKYRAKERTFWEGKYYRKGDIVETANGEGVAHLEELLGQKSAPKSQPKSEPKSEE